MFKLKTAYGKANDCVIVKRGRGKKVRYDIISKTEGPMLVMNIPEYNRSETVIALKSYSENAGLLEWCEKTGLVKKVVAMRLLSTFAMAYIVELDAEKLAEMMEKGA